MQSQINIYLKIAITLFSIEDSTIYKHSIEWLKSSIDNILSLFIYCLLTKLRGNWYWSNKGFIYFKSSL